MTYFKDLITNLEKDLAIATKHLFLKPDKKDRCEVCGRKAEMHESNHDFCLVHWKRWVTEE